MKPFAQALLLLVLAATPVSAFAQSATASGVARSSNPGTAASGGTPGHGPDASASAGTTPQDQQLEKKNDKVQSICKGC